MTNCIARPSIIHIFNGAYTLVYNECHSKWDLRFGRVLIKKGSD